MLVLTITCSTITLAVFILEISCRLEPLPDELSSRLSAAQCISNASDRFFQDGEILLVSLPVHEVNKGQASAILVNQLLFFELFSRSRLSIIIKKTTLTQKDEKYEKSVDNYVIQVRVVSELEENLSVLRGYASWNPHAKFVIFSVTRYEDNTEAAASIVQQLWQEKIVNGIILLPNAEDTAIFDVYSWFPFAGGHCGDGFDKIKITDKCKFGEFVVGKNWFPQKIPNNLNGCPVRVRTVVWPPYVLPPNGKVFGTKNEYEFTDGLEILLLNTMAQMANFSIVYTALDVIQDWGSIYLNGTATGAMLYLKNEEGDVAVSSFAASIESNMHFDSITYGIPESLKWCVPHAEIIPRWQNLLGVVSIDTMLIISVLYIATSFCLWKLSVFEVNESKSYKSLLTCMQNSLAVLVNMGIKFLPKSFKIRLFFLLWVFFSLHLDVSYQTSLISVFTKPRYDEQILNFKDIIQKKLKMWFLSTTRRFFTNNHDWQSEKVLANWRDCNDVRMCLHQTAFERDSAMITPRLYIKFIKNRYVTKDGEPLLYCFKDSIVTYPLEMLLRKGCPFQKNFAALVGRITSAGLFAHWEKQILEYRIENTIMERTGDEKKAFVITIEYLYFLFLELVVGYVLGFLSLIIEIYVYRKNQLKLAKQKLFLISKKK